MASLLGAVFSAAGAVVALCVSVAWLLRRPSSPAARRTAAALGAVYLLSSLAIVPHTAGRVWSATDRRLTASDVPAGNTAIVLLGGGDVFVRGWTDTLAITTPVEGERVL